MRSARQLATVVLCVVFGMTSCQSQGKRPVINGPEDLTEQQRRDIETLSSSVSQDEVCAAVSRLRETVLRDGTKIDSLPALGIEVDDESTGPNSVLIRHQAWSRPLFLILVVRNGRIKDYGIKS